MNFVTVEGRTLKQALRALIETVDRGMSVPVLACVKLSLSAGGLRLDATDLDVTVTAEIDVIDGAGEWSLCLGAHALAGIAHVAGVMPVRIEPGDKATVTLGEGEAVYTLDPLPAADFPEGIVETGELIERFGNGGLVALLDKVRAFISTEETRYYLNGVAWQRGAFGSRIAVTDGHRLAMCLYDSEAQEPATWIIPRKAVALLAKHFAVRDVAVHAAAGGKFGLVFASERLTLATKLIDGVYPDIDKVIAPCVAGAGTFALALKRPEALAAVARLLVLGRNVGRAIKLEACDGRLALERKGDSGGARAQMSSAWPEGLPAFGVNGGYFADMVAGCDGDVTLGLASAGAPILVRDADPAMTRILMPMRV